MRDLEGEKTPEGAKGTFKEKASPATSYASKNLGGGGGGIVFSLCSPDCP